MNLLQDFTDPMTSVPLGVAVLRLVTAMLLDRFGLLGLPQQPITPTRLIGVALVILGVVVVRRG